VCVVGVGVYVFTYHYNENYIYIYITEKEKHYDKGRCGCGRKTEGPGVRPWLGSSESGSPLWTRVLIIIQYPG
jgi:hypothetical protein